MPYCNETGTLTEAESGRHWSRSEIRRQILARINAYRKAGLDAGDRVLVHFGNQLEFFAELLAAWQLGACVIPVDARLTPFEVSTLARTARARFSVFAETPDPERIRAVKDSQVLLTSELGAREARPFDDSRYPDLDADALILFTSGSTGEPKGVVHTHRSLLARWSGLRQAIGLAAYRRTLCLLPTHFGHGLICNCLYPWLNGCDLVLTQPFQPGLLLGLGKLLDEHEISFMSSVPSVWNLALKSAPPQAGLLQRVHIGSAPLSEHLWRKVQDWSGTNEVFNTYGITETGSWLAGTTGGRVEPESGLIGASWDAEIRVLDADGRPCAAGQAGMVWLHTAALMKGYFNRPDLTQRAVHNGWFKTGDIGLLDEQGRLFLKGRERDEINKGGMKVFPADIDEVAERHEAVRDVCSFACPDDFYGENVGLAVVMPGADDEALRGLYEWLKTHLAEHKLPVRWYLLDEIPRTSRGKINRASVAAACSDATPLDLRELLR